MYTKKKEERRKRRNSFVHVELRDYVIFSTQSHSIRTN